MSDFKKENGAPSSNSPTKFSTSVQYRPKQPAPFTKFRPSAELL